MQLANGLSVIIPVELLETASVHESTATIPIFATMWWQIPGGGTGAGETIWDLIN